MVLIAETVTAATVAAAETRSGMALYGGSFFAFSYIIVVGNYLVQ